MSTLREYLEIGNKVERLTQFLDDEGERQEEYAASDDFVEPYIEVLHDSELNLDEIDDWALKQIALGLWDKNKTDVIWESLEVHFENSIWAVTNSVTSITIGEVECQFSGLYDPDTKVNCIYSELIKGMSDKEIKEAKNDSEYCISGDCLYIDMSFTSVHLIFDEDKFINNLLEEVER